MFIRWEANEGLVNHLIDGGNFFFAPVFLAGTIFIFLTIAIILCHAYLQKSMYKDTFKVALLVEFPIFMVMVSAVWKGSLHIWGGMSWLT